MAIVPNWTRLIAMSLAAAMPCWSAASADTTVDLELVLAVDVSLSMDEDEQQLQRDGFVSAFRDKGVIQAIKSGPHGRIAVTYVEWGGKGLQKVQMPWRVIASQEQAHAFADELALQPFSRDRRTSTPGNRSEKRLATVCTSLSPRPHEIHDQDLILGHVGRDLGDMGERMAGSSAGRMPSVRESSLKASSASLSVTGTYSTRPMSFSQECSGPMPG
jgi:hypothetical protein